jgi:hypothetical protein
LVAATGGFSTTSGMPVNDYDLLRDYLKKQTLAELVLSFEQIEEIIDAALPRAAHPAGEDAAARSLPRGRLYRDQTGGWQEREVQEDAAAASAARSRRVLGRGLVGSYPRRPAEATGSV